MKHHAAPSGEPERVTAQEAPYRATARRNRRFRLVMTTWLAGTLLAVACSKDDSESGENDADDMDDSTGMTNGTTGFGPNFGQGGTQTNQNNQDTTSTEGRPIFDDDREVVPVESPTTTTCGGNVCSDRLVFGDVALQPCCTGSDDDDCGLETDPLEFMAIQNQCADLAAPGGEDDDCPSLDYDDTVATTNLPGCCMPSGECGVVANLLLVANFGCVDPREFFDLPEQLADMYGASCEASGSDAGTASADEAEDGSDASVADE